MISKVANLGHDADTTAAIYGQIAGAFYGVDSIPMDWRKKVMFSSLIQLFTDELLSLSDHIQLPTLPKSTEELAPVSSIDPQSRMRQTLHYFILFVAGAVSGLL